MFFKIKSQNHNNYKNKTECSEQVTNLFSSRCWDILMNKWFLKTFFPTHTSSLCFYSHNTTRNRQYFNNTTTLSVSFRSGWPSSEHVICKKKHCMDLRCAEIFFYWCFQHLEEEKLTEWRGGHPPNIITEIKRWTDSLSLFMSKKSKMCIAIN